MGTTPDFSNAYQWRRLGFKSDRRPLSNRATQVIEGSTRDGEVFHNEASSDGTSNNYCYPTFRSRMPWFAFTILSFLIISFMEDKVTATSKWLTFVFGTIFGSVCVYLQLSEIHKAELPWRFHVSEQLLVASVFLFSVSMKGWRQERRQKKQPLPQAQAQAQAQATQSPLNNSQQQKSKKKKKGSNNRKKRR